jgi:hypothetical protein
VVRADLGDLRMPPRPLPGAWTSGVEGLGEDWTWQRTLTLTELYILTCSGADDDIFFCPELGTTDRGTCR